jgi:prepilin-type processing-associated H-X9-DG protein
LNRARETANRVKCASNERQIGQALLLYANDHQGKYPDEMGTLVKAEEITPEVFLCPTRESSLPPEVHTMTPDQQVAWVNANADYVYLGKGQTFTSPADRIILYEKPGAHSGDGMNILYGDGHVEFQRAADANRQIDRQERRGEQGL